MSLYRLKEGSSGRRLVYYSRQEMMAWSSYGVGEKWSNPKCIFEIETMGFLIDWKWGMRDREQLMF